MKQSVFNHLKFLFFIGTTFFKISLFVVGGGLAMIPVIEDIFVHRHKLLKKDDIPDMIAITQTIPGLIAVNAAIFVGHRLAGWKGSVIATIGVLIPSVMIISLIAAFFPLLSLDNPHVLNAFLSIRACVTGIFICLAIRLGKKVLTTHRDFFIIALLIIGLINGINVLFLILFSICLGLINAYKLNQKVKSMKGK